MGPSLLSEWCVVTSFYQSLQAMSSFMRFSICASYCTLSVSTLRLSFPYLQYDSNGTFRNVPLLLSHACPCAGWFDGYEKKNRKAHAACWKCSGRRQNLSSGAFHSKLPFGANGKVAEFFIGKCCENTDISTVCWQSVRGIYSEKAFDA